MTPRRASCSARGGQPLLSGGHSPDDVLQGLGLTLAAGALLSKASGPPELEQRTEAVGALGSPFSY